MLPKYNNLRTLVFLIVVSSLVTFPEPMLAAVVEEENPGQIMSAEELTADWMHVCNDASGRTRENLDAAGPPLVNRGAIDNRLSVLFDTFPMQLHRTAKNAVWLFEGTANHRSCGLLAIGFTTAEVLKVLRRLMPSRKWVKLQQSGGVTKFVSHTNTTSPEGSFERRSYCISDNFPILVLGSSLNAPC